MPQTVLRATLICPRSTVRHRSCFGLADESRFGNESRIRRFQRRRAAGTDKKKHWQASATQPETHKLIAAFPQKIYTDVRQSPRGNAR